MGNIAPMIGLAVFLGLYFHFFVEVFDPKSVAGKRILITGGTSEVGEQLAYQYSRLGAKVFISAEDPGRLEVVAKECEKLGAERVDFVVTADLSEPLQRDKLMTEAVRRLGGLDVIILNHAVASSGPWLGSPANVSTLLGDLRHNFVSSVDLASRALSALTASRGAIGVVSSVAAKIPVAALSSYSADEFALHGFFAALRVELLRGNTGVSVTACVLGPVDAGIKEDRKKKVGKEVFWGLDATVTAPDAADAIVTGVATHQREVYHGKLVWILVTLHQIFPGFIENLIGVEPTQSRLS